MVIMALDHVRDFFYVAAASVSPTDLAKTTPILFLTRWITHFCLPVFMFTAGAGAYLWWRRGDHTKRQLSRFLITRGFWFILLELTVMQFAYDFNVSSSYLLYLLILWIFGLCMILMAALIWLPFSLLAALSLLIVAGHNLLDGIGAQSFGARSWLWNLVHQPGVVPLAGRQVLISYTLLPWIGVMAAGFCLGRVFEWEARDRRRFVGRLGAAAVLAFLVIRSINRYGDPAPWSVQKQPVFTVLSFLNCTKYPGSLDFLLMTLGPALLLLAWLDRRPPGANNPLVIFGRVPFFYFVAHFYLIHLLTAIFALVRYGGAALRFIFNPPPSMGGPAQLFPHPYGYSLGVVYLVWMGIVVLLYPPCRWYAKLRTTHRAWWLSYL